MLLLTLAVSARAHVGLEDPPPRYPTAGYDRNKSCPCGVGPNDQLCSLPERSDPNRTTTVTQFAAGETITVRAHEVIGHAGRWRIAFDPEGADLVDFNANILLDVEDTPGSSGNVGQGDLWEFEVTLPDVPCTNCTLQLIQMMDGNRVDPVPDPTGRSTYYQCADIELLGATPPDTATPTGTTTPTNPTSSSAYSDPTVGGDPADSGSKPEGGCGCAATPAPGSLSGSLLLGGLGWLMRRRRTTANVCTRSER